MLIKNMLPLGTHTHTHAHKRSAKAFYLPLVYGGQRIIFFFAARSVKRHQSKRLSKLGILLWREREVIYKKALCFIVTCESRAGERGRKKAHDVEPLPLERLFPAFATIRWHLLPNDLSLN
jgi:hypothetical protein